MLFGCVWRRFVLGFSRGFIKFVLMVKVGVMSLRGLFPTKELPRTQILCGVSLSVQRLFYYNVLF